MINKLCFYIALINYNVFYSKTKGLKFHFWMSQGKALYQFEENDPLALKLAQLQLFEKVCKFVIGGEGGEEGEGEAGKTQLY